MEDPSPILPSRDSAQKKNTFSAPWNDPILPHLKWANWLGQSAPKKVEWRSRLYTFVFQVVVSGKPNFHGKHAPKMEIWENSPPLGIEVNLQNWILYTYMIYHVRSFVPTLHHRKYIVPKSYPYERIDRQHFSSHFASSNLQRNNPHYLHYPPEV